MDQANAEQSHGQLPSHNSCMSHPDTTFRHMQTCKYSHDDPAKHLCEKHVNGPHTKVSLFLSQPSTAFCKHSTVLIQSTHFLHSPDEISLRSMRKCWKPGTPKKSHNKSKFSNSCQQKPQKQTRKASQEQKSNTFAVAYTNASKSAIWGEGMMNVSHLIFLFDHTPAKISMKYALKGF